MNKLIMLVIDGLRYDTARASMGYLQHLVEKQKAAVYKVQAELPTLSRPLYEVLLTGTPAWQNGIVSNQTVRLSTQESLFHLARKNGLRTAAAAYYWVSELVLHAPFRYIEDREQHDEELPIQHGMFYFEDSYPDSHLLIDAEQLRRRYDPHFLYIHPMGMDDVGHRCGSDSAQYRGKAIQMDSLLASLVPAWMAEGYHIIITSDHGMNEDGMHGGQGEGERMVPLYCISNQFTPGDYSGKVIPQLWMAPLCCRLLSMKPSDEMTAIGEWEGWHP